MYFRMKISSIPGNWSKWRELTRDPKYQGLVREYLSKPNPWLFTQEIKPLSGSFMCSFHNHSCNYQLTQVARRAAQVGYDLFAITDHNEDSKFKGERMKYFEFSDQEKQPIPGIFLLRGTEYNCIVEKDSIHQLGSVKLIFLGYKSPIPAGLNLKEAIAAAKEQESLIFTTATFNDGSRARGISPLELMDCEKEVDAIGVLDAGFGICGKRLNKCYVSDIRAKKFVQDAKEEKKAEYYENNAHNLGEIGACATYLPQDSLPLLLGDPTDVLSDPSSLVQQLAQVFREHPEKITNQGGYVPIFSWLHPMRAKVAAEDAVESQVRNLREASSEVSKKLQSATANLL